MVSAVFSGALIHGPCDDSQIMRVPVYLTIVCMLSCVAGDAAAEELESPDHYAALGVRAFAHDPTAVVIAGKARLVGLGALSGSVRAALLYGDYFEARLPVTVEGALPLGTWLSVSPFAGVGAAYNTDRVGALDPMVSAGVDVRLPRRVVLSATVNVIWQRTIGDTDKEGMGAIGFAF